MPNPIKNWWHLWHKLRTPIVVSTFQEDQSQSAAPLPELTVAMVRDILLRENHIELPSTVWRRPRLRVSLAHVHDGYFSLGS